jgi:class 3 adenylate cyclase/alpha-beta hydrolase superfamily lysophospholipase
VPGHQDNGGRITLTYVENPETRYARRPDGVNIAYQVVGSGEQTMIWCQGLGSHLDLQWTDPDMARFFSGLASFTRLVLYDKAGTGLSDPIAHVPTVEERSEDIRTVLDAVGVERAVIFGESEGGPSAIVFAASHPERTEALLLFGTIFKGQPTDAELEQMGASREELEAGWTKMNLALDHWGEGRTLDLLAPSIAHNAMVRRGFGTFERASVSPGMARGLMEVVRSIDVSSVVGAISAPTLVLHRTGDFLPIGGGRLIAKQIPNAKFVELPGEDHAFWVGDSDAIVGAAQEFLTGAAAPVEPDRLLATVAFTDIVDSTRHAATIGDAAWRELLQRHDSLLRSRTEAGGGRVVKSLGDGALLTFNGPARAVRCVEGIVRSAEELGVQLRAGVHTGECEAIGDDLGGLAIHIGARVTAAAAGGEVLVSSTVRELVVGSNLSFEDRGEHELKGVPDRWHLYALAQTDQDRQRPITPVGEHMTLADRASVRIARRAPGALRAMGRLTQRQRG